MESKNIALFIVLGIIVFFIIFGLWACSQDENNKLNNEQQ